MEFVLNGRKVRYNAPEISSEPIRSGYGFLKRSKPDNFDTSLVYVMGAALVLTSEIEDPARRAVLQACIVYAGGTVHLVRKLSNYLIKRRAQKILTSGLPPGWSYSSRD
jgi:hypothetical protein